MGLLNRSHKAKRPRRLKPIVAMLLAVIVGGAVYLALSAATSTPDSLPQQVDRQATASVRPRPNVCASNQLDKLILVSISKQTTWACNGQTLALSTPVITGNENLASDLTPTGTYHVLLKQTDVHLIGCDTDQPNNCWNDYVNYDLIFLYNQYGHYDLLDATWRSPSEFGHVNIYSTNASHGCVETPLNAMAWLYDWAGVGTTVQIES